MDKGSSGSAEGLDKQFANSLKIASPRKKLKEISLKGIADFIASDECKNVITMAGAGISTSAGIPDFRSPDIGVYNKLAEFDLPYPEAVFDIRYFKMNPKPFFVVSKDMFPASIKPTVCHHFIKMLDDKGKLLRHYTQNVDTLERVAGLNPEKLVEAHGSVHSNTCLKCDKKYPSQWMREQLDTDKIPPLCELTGCGGVVKPDVVIFGDPLPEKFFSCIQKDLPKCDLLIVVGTSLTVEPFASIVRRVPEEAPRLYINQERMPYAFKFDDDDNYRDVYQGSSCDEGCALLANMLGWGEELKQRVKDQKATLGGTSGAQQK